MRNSIVLLFIIMTLLAITSCNIEDIEKYNDDFVGSWRTDVHFSATKGDSIRHYLTIDGSDSGFGIGCKVDEPFEECLDFKTGKVKYNKASKGIQVGNSVKQIHYVQQEPHINDEGKWIMVIDKVSYYRY